MSEARTDRWYRAIYRLIWLVLRSRHRVKAIGLEHLPEGGAVLCPNHTALADPLYVCCSLTRRVRPVPLAKVELSRIPVVGWILRRAGIIFVDRGGADIQAVKASLQVLKQGEKLLLFPEGTRVRNGLDRHGRPVEAKEGAALFATRAGVPLIPIYIQVKRPLFRPVAVVFGEPYCPETAGRKATAEELKQITRELMRRVFALGEGLE